MYLSQIRSQWRLAPRIGGGGGLIKIVLYGEALPQGMTEARVWPLTLLYTIFDKKGTPFVYLLVTK